MASGVPQGSVLGPTLFLIFINDIDCVVDGVASMLSEFADDTKLIRCVSNDADRDALQSDLNELVKWSDTWQMEFNKGKCKVIHFGRRNQGFTYTMGGHAPAGAVLENISEEKDLGVLIHESLTPTSQCAKAVMKANQVLGQMARAFTYRDRYTWVHLYRQYVRPHLEYAIQAWCPWTDADINSIENVQRRAIRMVSGLNSSVYEDRLRELGLTTLTERRLRGDMIEVWKIMHGEVDVDPNIWFDRAVDHSVRTTRQASSPYNLKPRPWNHVFRKNFFSQRVVKPWNALSYDIQNSNSMDSFKAAYDRFRNSQC